MTTIFALAFSAALSAAVTQTPQFAEEIPNGIGYGSLFELKPAADGHVAKCIFSGLIEINGKPKIGFPSAAYISDACRKLSSRPWQVRKNATGDIQSSFYFCRALDSSPDFAYCEQRFGA